MRKINRFFWFCSGAHIPTLLKTPSEHNKYVGIGATIFFTGLFAAIAGSYALYFVFSGNAYALLASISFGIVWGMAIFNMDRYIVASIDKAVTPFKQFLQAAPRLFLAILVGVVISRPLELKIFDKEITEQLKVNYLNAQRQRIDKLNRSFDDKYTKDIDKLRELKSELEALIQSMKRERQNLNFEIFGSKTAETSGVMGYGPYAKRKEDALKVQEKREQDLRLQIGVLEQFIKDRRQADGLLSEKIMTSNELGRIVQFAGFADRNEALGQLKYDEEGKLNESNYWSITFISLLFIFFESLPVLVKLMSAKGPYDVLTGNEELLVIYRSEQDKMKEITVLDQVQPARVSADVKKIKSQLEGISV
ncbi:DUF4407 domain-containing protein [Olivibacter sp. CPCC 100613]|uniref:DUF4407 domain-containing protein n=1 Tax=Olivibacter sp. CPCC 100613 TaxID=3079931 RepID=UPI002FFABA4F